MKFGRDKESEAAAEALSDRPQRHVRIHARDLCNFHFVNKKLSLNFYYLLLVRMHNKQ